MAGTKRLSAMPKTNYKDQIDPELWESIRNFPYNMALVSVGNVYQEAAYRKTEVPEGIVQKTIEISGTQDTFQVSYVGDINWGGLSEYMREIYAITQGHLMLEVNATTDKFCISFQTLTKAETYLEAFLKVLEEEGIPYEVGEKEPSNLPQIQFV